MNHQEKNGSYRADKTALDIAKGAVAGLVAGVAAAFVMNKFQQAWKNNFGRDQQSKGNDSGKEPATVRAAEMLSDGIFDHDLSPDEKEVAGPLMHYAMGGISGLIYGLAVEVDEHASVGSGLPFGAAVWMVADNLVLPSVGLAKWPTAYGAKRHAYALASHLVYGLATEKLRSAGRNVL
jgi:hypothetical protein